MVVIYIYIICTTISDKIFTNKIIVVNVKGDCHDKKVVEKKKVKTPKKADGVCYDKIYELEFLS